MTLKCRDQKCGRVFDFSLRHAWPIPHQSVSTFRRFACPGVVVTSKMSFPRRLSHENGAALCEFFASRVAANLSPDDYVFHGHKGPITRHLIYAIVRRALEKVGIKGPR
ncbi:hypothetical protein ACFLW4_02550 [Chloroflexota bacterium]